MPDFTVSAGLARGLMELAVSRGADRAALAARAGIDPAALEDQDNRIPYERYVALTRAGQELAKDPALALHYGETRDLSEISIAGLIIQAAESFYELMALINRYGQLVVEVDVGEADRFQMARGPEGLWLIDTRRNPNDFPEMTEATFARVMCGSSRFLEREAVKAVRVTHAAPPYRDEYERIFQTPVTFDSDRNGLLIDEAKLSTRTPQQPRYVFGILTEHGDALIKSLQGAKTTRGRVEAAIMPLLHTGEVSIDAVAEALALSRPTLYRRLKAEGVTFEKVLDDLRHRLALDYLRGARATVNEIAYLVGFSDPTAFSRAFKRWTGTSPRAARQGA